MYFFTVFINIVTLVLLGILFAIELRYLGNIVAVQFVALTGFAFIWALGSFAEFSVTGISAKLFWRNFCQVGSFFVPAASLTFALTYSGFFPKTKKAMTIAAYVMQAIPLILLLTDELHHLMRVSHNLYIGPAGLSSLSVVSTHLGYFFVSINFLLTGASLAILVLFRIRVAPNMRKQVSLVTLGLSIPAVYAVLRVSLGEKFGFGIPISSVFAAGCAVILFALHSFNFLSLEPIARSQMLDVIDEGIIVCSSDDRVIDVNRAGLRMMLPEASGEEAAKPERFVLIERLLREQVGETRFCHLEEGVQLSFCAEGVNRHLSFKAHSLRNSTGKRVGAVCVLRDVTREVLQMENLKRRAERDGLTQLYNRDAFIELFEGFRHLRKEPSCLIIMDIDDFKTINDAYGHLAGDKALLALCECCDKRLRADDLFGRVGGDEFVIFLARTDEMAAKDIAHGLIEAIGTLELLHEGHPFRMTISAGVAALEPVEGNAIGGGFAEAFSRADRALYEAKAHGKNGFRIA